MTILSSVLSDGETQCMVFDRSTNKETFEVYIEKILCQTLRVGDIVVIDNPHKSVRAKELIKSKQAHFYT